MNDARHPAPAAHRRPTIASFAAMPAEMREQLSVGYFCQLFERDAKAALQAYALLADTPAVPNLYLTYALADPESAQLALVAIQANMDAQYSATMVDSITSKYGPPKTSTDVVREMLLHVRSGAHRDVPTIPDNRVLGVRRSERVSPPQAETKAPKPR